MRTLCEKKIRTRCNCSQICIFLHPSQFVPGVVGCARERARNARATRALEAQNRSYLRWLGDSACGGCIETVVENVKTLFARGVASQRVGSACGVARGACGGAAAVAVLTSCGVARSLDKTAQMIRVERAGEPSAAQTPKLAPHAGVLYRGAVSSDQIQHWADLARSDPLAPVSFQSNGSSFLPVDSSSEGSVGQQLVELVVGMIGGCDGLQQLLGCKEVNATVVLLASSDNGQR